MKEIYFLENHDSSIDYNGKDIVSLHPAVSHILAAKKVKYTIPEDFYSLKDLTDVEDIYFKDQLEWFKSFDDFLKNNITFCADNNIPLATSCYLRLKYAVDTVYIYSFMLKNFFDKRRDAARIIYVHERFGNNCDCSIFDFKKGHRQIFKELLVSYCRINNIEFSERIANNDSLLPAAVDKKLFYRNKTLKALLKNAYCFLLYNKASRIFSFNADLSGKRMLFMHTGSSDINIPFRECMSRKATLFSTEEDSIIKEGLFARKRFLINDIKSAPFKNNIEQECLACSHKLEAAEYITGWLDKKCGLETAGIITPFLKRFVLKDAAEILNNAARVARFYTENSVDYVFARGNADKLSIAFLIAARHMKNAKSVCIQHASFAYKAKIFPVFDAVTYDYIFTRDNISQAYYKENLIKEGRWHDVAIFPAYHYLAGIKISVERKSKPRRLREQIVYVEKKFFDRIMWLNDRIYPMTWYYEFQKKLINFFATEKRFDFIYKHADAPGQVWAKQSTLEYIRELGADNIKVYKKSFTESLKGADRVIVDFPSGALFETVAARKPVLCLYGDSFNIIDEARDMFGKSLQRFTSYEEAILEIKKFLHGDKNEYLVKETPWENNFMGSFKDAMGLV